MTIQLAHLYATLCMATVFLQVALIAGLPLGDWAQGGQGAGPLPRAGRAMAALFIPVLLFQALAILSAAGFPGLGWPRWTGWSALVVQIAAVGLNLLSRNSIERTLWAPLNAVMAGVALVVLTG